jgi:hypothetical protein
MSQNTQRVCRWCGETLVFVPTGIGLFCNAACRQQFYRRPGFTKRTWEAILRERQRWIQAVVLNVNGRQV